MNRILYNILKFMMLFLVGGVVSSCSDEMSLEQDDTEVLDGKSILSFSISLSAGGVENVDEKFEPGVGFENYLDIAGGDYRIYFFDANNIFIDDFVTLIPPYPAKDPITVNGVPTYYYIFVGKKPKEIKGDFKIVFLANWKKYPEPVKGVTTIENLVCHENSQFNYLDTPDKDKEWLAVDRLIPFYGVRKYSLKDHSDQKYIDESGNITEEGNYIDLSVNKNNVNTAIPLIRAMAKIEVILDNEFASFSQVIMTRVNTKGYCSPYSESNWEFDYSDYFHGYEWDTDFTRALHLVGGKNDVTQTTLEFKRVSSRTVNDDKSVTPEKWVAYVPEYLNIGRDNFTSIEVTLDKPDPSLYGDWDYPTRNIYFATVVEDGSEAIDKEVNGIKLKDFYNIERNNIYRFYVKMTTSFSCVVTVLPYTGVYLNPSFGFD